MAGLEIFLYYCTHRDLTSYILIPPPRPHQRSRCKTLSTWRFQGLKNTKFWNFWNQNQDLSSAIFLRMT